MRGEHKHGNTWVSTMGVAASGTGVVVDIAASCAYASPPCVTPDHLHPEVVYMNVSSLLCLVLHVFIFYS